MGLNDRILLVGKYLVAIRKQNTAKKKIANEIWKEHKVWQTEQVKEVAHVTDDQHIGCIRVETKNTELTNWNQSTLELILLIIFIQ